MTPHNVSVAISWHLGYDWDDTKTQDRIDDMWLALLNHITPMTLRVHADMQLSAVDIERLRLGLTVVLDAIEVATAGYPALKLLKGGG